MYCFTEPKRLQLSYKIQIKMKEEKKNTHCKILQNWKKKLTDDKMYF